MRFFTPAQQRIEERLLWSRDTRFVARVSQAVRSDRIVELESGSCLIAPGHLLVDSTIEPIADASGDPPYGLVAVNGSLAEAERYITALSAAVQLSGIADRIGMAQSTQIVQTKTLDYFFNLRHNHQVYFQPIVELASGTLHEYECLFRPVMPMLPQSISAIVQAAIDTTRSVELDAFIVRQILDRAGELQRAPAAAADKPLRFSINLTPASLLDPRFEAKAIAAMVREVGLIPHQVTLECTEQQAVEDVVPLRRQVKALRRLGFGFAIDDAGAGYASFALIAALRPSIIKIDRQIIHGIRTDDAKQALVEAFVSFGRRIGARLVAEGIETRRELATLNGLGVELGQGFLLGRPTAQPTSQRRRPARLVSPEGARTAIREIVTALPNRVPVTPRTTD